MFHSGVTKLIGQWQLIPHDCNITVIHSTSISPWKYEVKNKVPPKETAEGDTVFIKGGDLLRVLDAGSGSLVVKIDRIGLDGNVINADGSVIAGANVNRVVSTDKKQTLWRNTPISVNARMMISEGWHIYLGKEIHSVPSGTEIWVPACTPIGFSSEGYKDHPFMYDILAFQMNVPNDYRVKDAEDRWWSRNYNYSETIHVSHSCNWAFQFENEDPFELIDGMKVDIDCGRRYRLMRKDLSVSMSEASLLLKYKDIEVTDSLWGEKNLDLKDC